MEKKDGKAAIEGINIFPYEKNRLLLFLQRIHLFKSSFMQ